MYMQLCTKGCSGHRGQKREYPRNCRYRVVDNPKQVVLSLRRWSLGAPRRVRAPYLLREEGSQHSPPFKMSFSSLRPV